MRILHIGDFHYKAKKANYEQNLMIEKMIEALKQRGKIDFVFFSGDLVHSGTNPNDFNDAYNILLKRLSDELNVDASNVIISPGNHDVDRRKCSRGIISFFDSEINSNEKIDNEFIKNSIDFQSSIESSKNFKTFLETIHGSDIIRDLYSLHIRHINGNKIAIVCINSAWLSSEFKDDKGSLMFPPCVLKDILSTIKTLEVKHKFILIHHPFYYFKEFNSIELEDIVNKEFDMIFSGHIHREQISTKYAGDNGVYNNTTQATLTFDDAGEIGYSIIEYNVEEEFNADEEGFQQIILERGSYNKKGNVFFVMETLTIQVPCGLEKANQNNLRKKITSKYKVELANANQLLLDYEKDSKLDFLDVFTAPVLTTKTPTESSNSESKGIFNYEELQTSSLNYLIFGKDKCGKTSLLRKIQLYFLKNFSQIGMVPLFLDYKELENSDSPINIVEILCATYAINKTNAINLLKKNKLLLLLDNLDTNSNVNNYIIEFLEENKDTRFIFCSDFLTSRIFFEELDHLNYEKIYFNDLSRKEIRLYTDKQQTVKDFNKEDVLDRIVVICKQLQLPTNYWTVSLILLIYKKSNDDYNKNLFGILDMCVDEILQKKQLLNSKSKLNFEQYKELCSQIAYYLLTKHKDNIYSASYSELISFISSIIAKSPRLVASEKDIFDFLFATGLLKEKNSRFTFRLNGIFEYFLAYYISHHPTFKAEILNNDSIYLAFKNELEIYSGLKRDDEVFVTNIFAKTKCVFNKLIDGYLTNNTLDNTLVSKYHESTEFATLIRKMKINEPLRNEIKDIIHDHQEPLTTTSEVHVKELIDANVITPEILETYLNILARVFKNSDNISNTDLVYEIFDYLLDAYCVFGFYLIEQVSQQAKKENLSSQEINSDVIIGEELLKMITNFMPVLTQVMLYDGIGHISVVKILKNKIAEYSKDSKNNQYKLFVLYFLLIDIDVKANKQIIDDVFRDVNLAPLKVSTFFKMNFYLAFKAYKNKELEHFFKQKIKEAQMRMDNKIDPDKMNFYLSKKQKRNIVKKGSEDASK